MPLDIEVIDDDGCARECATCREMNQVLQLAAASGVSRAEWRAAPGPGYRVRHLSCEQAGEARLWRRRLPIVRIDGRVVLEGGWTEAQVAGVVAQALRGAAAARM